MRISLPRTLSLLMLAAPLAACHNDPIDPSSLADRISGYTREMVHQTGGGVAFADDSNSGLNKISQGMGDASSGLAGAMPAPRARRACCF